MTVPVVALLTAKTGSEAALSEVLSTLAAASREEEGNVSYDVFSSNDAPGTFVTVEHWRDQAAIDGHFQTPHLAAALGSAGELLEGAPAIHTLSPLG